MTQAPAVWQELLGSELVSSEDESWLQQSGFHLSDSSDDENSNLLSQAYVNAVAQLKKPAVKEFKSLPGASQHMQLRDTTAASERLALPHAQSKGGTVKPEEPSGFHSQSNAQALAPHRAPLQSPVLQDQGNQLPAAPTSMPHDAQPHAAASAAEHTQAINQQDAQNGNAAAGAERQQGTMQALQMLFPQELQRTPAAPKDKPITADSVRPQAPVVDPATGVQGEHLSTDAAAPVHAFSPGKAEGPEMPQPQSKADAHDPAAPFTSLQYSLSEEQMALIHENAQQYMQEHEDSPWQLPVLQPAVTSPEVVHTGLQAQTRHALPPAQPLSPGNNVQALDAPTAATPTGAAAPKAAPLPTSTAVQASQSPPAAVHTGLTTAVTPVGVAPLSLELSPSPTAKVAVAQQQAGSRKAANTAPAGIAAADAAEASLMRSSSTGGKVLTASSAAHPAPLPKSAATPSELADDLAATSTKATHSMPSSGQADFNSGSETQKRALPKQDSPAVHSPPAKQAQQAASAQTDKRHKAPLRQDGLPSTLNRASLADAATAVDNSSLPTTAEAFLATLQTSRIAADVPLPSRHAHKQQSLPAASSAGNTAGPSETAATSAAPQTDAGVPVSSPDVQTPVRPLPLVTALSADQLRAILSSAGMQPAGTPMPVTASMPPIPPPGGSKTRPPASPIPAAHLGATLSPRAEVSTAYTPSAPVAAPTGAAATPSATPLSSSIGDKLVAAAVTPAVPSGAHAPAAHSTPVHAGTNASASATDALKEGMTLSASVSAPAAPPPVVLPVPPQVAVPAVQAASAAAAVVAPALTPSAAQGVPPPPVLEVPQPTPSAALGVPPPPPLGSPPPKPTAAQGIPPLPPSAVPASSSVRDIPGPPLEDPPAPPLLPLLIASDPSLFSPQLKPASGTAAEPTQEKRKKKKRKRDEHQPVTAVTGTSMSAHQSKQAQQASQAAGTAVASQGPPVDAASFYARYQELAVKPAAAFQPLPPGPYAPRASPPPPHLPLPTPQLTAAQVASPPTKAPYLLSSFNKPLPLPTQGDAKRPRTHSASTKITVMRQVHSSSPVPAVGDQAVVAWLKNVKSLVHDPKQKFSLKNAIQAIGEFAIGSNAEEEIFLGNMHHQADVHHQISLIASFFGVDAMQGQNPSSFYETYRLTRLVKLPYAGILDQDTDPVVYSIVKLSRLCNDQGHNKQEKNRYLRELNGVMNLAKTMQLNFSSSPKPYRRGPLDKGAKQRIEQLLKLGYLIVKRPKSTPPIPPLYPPWKGKPIYGPSSATPQVQPLPSRAAATAASSSGAVPFIPGPAVAPVSLRLIQPPNSQVPTTSTFASVPLSPASMPASVPALLPSSAQALNVSAGFAPFPTQIAPLCLLPSSAPTPASLPSALSHLAHASDRVNPIQPISGPSSSGHSQLPLSPPAVPTAASQPSSSDATATLTLPPSQDTTAALVAAVGPVFEAFVAQTAAVVESPDMPVQALIAQVTQHLAAAIATAALQVVDARRQQGSAVIPFAEPLCITNPDMTQSAKPNTGAAKPQASQDVMRPHHTFDAEQLPHLTRLPGVSKPAQAETDVARLPSSDASVIDVIEKPAVACLSVAAPSEEKVKSLGSKQKTGSQGSLANKTSDDTQAKASKQVNSDEGKSRKSSGGRNVSNSPPSVSTLGQASVLPKTESQGKVSDAAPGTSKPVAASAGMKDSHGHAIQDKGKDSKKRSMTESTHDASRPAKRPHQLKAASGNSIEHEGYVVPGINASKYETGKHKSQVDTRSRHSAGAHQQGSRDVVSRSGSPRSSKSSGRSSPKDFRPLGASDFDSSRGSRHGSRSPRELSRLNGGSKSHRSQSMQEGSRRDVPAMPSRMSGAYGPGLSPDLPSVLPFEPAVDISLCQGFGAPDFRPVGLHHGNGGGWQQQDPSLFRPLPIPDISFAPDFTPHFCPGGPAN